MTTTCPKCGGATINSRKSTSTGRPMDTVACQSCNWSRVVVGALPPAPLSDEALADLLSKAEKATPGPWAIERSAHGGVVSIRGMTPVREDWQDDDDEPTLPAVVWDPNVFHHTRGPTDREYIVAANPATVTALVREVQRLRGELRRHRGSEDCRESIDMEVGE